MGSNREVHRNNSQTKVQLSLAEEFGIDIKDLYKVWEGYASHRISKDKDILTLLRSDEKKYNSKAIDYFTILGFELFSIEYYKMLKYSQEEMKIGE